MQKTTETTLGEIRAIVETDRDADPHMTRFADDTAELSNEAAVCIIINGDRVTYAAVPF